jgi:hypothetical protein
MIHERDLQILRRLHKATVDKSIIWSESADGWYSCSVGGREITCRFLYFEATNQPGADRQMIDFKMPGRNARFACGTQGFDLLMEILAEALGWKQLDYADPLKFLDKALPEDESE